MDNLFLTPKEIAEKTVAAGKMKTSLSTVKMLILGILSGIFIALGAEGSNLAACHLLASPDSFFLGKTIAGAVFGAGLMMVVLAGAELFTGNSLIFMGVLDGEVKASAMLKNWLFVYIGRRSRKSALRGPAGFRIPLTALKNYDNFLLYTFIEQCGINLMHKSKEGDSDASLHRKKNRDDDRRHVFCDSSHLPRDACDTRRTVYGR